MRFRTRGRVNVKRWGRFAADRIAGTAFDRALRAAECERRNAFVFAWNHGLGDVALGLVPLFARIRARIAESRIVVFTRGDIADAFMLAGVDELHVVPGLLRNTALDPVAAAARLNVPLPADATVFANPDPDRWLGGHRQEYVPALAWNAAWDAKADRLVAAAGGVVGIGAHVDSETGCYYGYVKDWPAAAWRELFGRFRDARRVRWLLFGCSGPGGFDQPNVLDLRGRTDLLELLAVIRTRCRVLVAPDSGVLATAYYLAADFPLDVVSLWSDPRQGVLKQGSPSPNPRLRHVPLLGREGDVRNIGVDDVARAIEAALGRASVERGNA